MTTKHEEIRSEIARAGKRAQRGKRRMKVRLSFFDDVQSVLDGMRGTMETLRAAVREREPRIWKTQFEELRRAHSQLRDEHRALMLAHAGCAENVHRLAKEEVLAAQKVTEEYRQSRDKMAALYAQLAGNGEASLSEALRQRDTYRREYETLLAEAMGGDSAQGAATTAAIKERDEARADLERVRGYNTELTEQRNAAQAEVQALRERVVELTQQVLVRTNERDAARGAGTVHEALEANEELRRVNGDLQQAINRAEGRANDQRDEVARLMRHIERLDGKLGGMARELAECTERDDDDGSEVERLRARVAEQRIEAEASGEMMRKLTVRVAELNTEVDQLKDELMSRGDIRGALLQMVRQYNLLEVESEKLTKQVAHLVIERDHVVAANVEAYRLMGEAQEEARVLREQGADMPEHRSPVGFDGQGGPAPYSDMPGHRLVPDRPVLVELASKARALAVREQLASLAATRTADAEAFAGGERAEEAP